MTMDGVSPSIEEATKMLQEQYGSIANFSIVDIKQIADSVEEYKEIVQSQHEVKPHTLN